MTTPPRLTGIDHVHVFVSDRAAAERWYADVLGLHRLPQLAHWAVDGGPLTIGNGDVHLALFEQPALPCRSTIALATDAAGFLAWQRHLASLAPTLEDHGLTWSLYFRDPDGNPYEITCHDYATVSAALAGNAGSEP